MSIGRPHLAVALVCAFTIAGLLAIALRRETLPQSRWDVAPPHLYDQPFRGAPLSGPASK